jgi:hypothetical protein
MKRTNTLLTATLGLIMSATLMAESANTGPTENIPISALPYTITAPGTYVLTGNLNYRSQTSSATDTAISISTAVRGPVILDLNGFTITGNGNSSISVGIGGAFTGPYAANAYPITVRNGTLKNFAFGIWAETNLTTAPLTAININNITLFLTQPPSGDSTCIVFGGYVDSSTVRNCTFNNASYGIEDVLSHGGNRYSNITLNNVDNSFFVTGTNGGKTTILEDCHYEAPAN